jgi:hypothetical protein
MWTFFLIIAIFGILFLMVYLLLELNELEKKITGIVQEIKDHYKS